MEPAIFQELLALEQHRDARRRKHQSRGQRGALLGKPAVHLAGPDLLRHPRTAIGDLVMRFGIYDPLEGVRLVTVLDGSADRTRVPQGVSRDMTT